MKTESSALPGLHAPTAPATTSTWIWRSSGAVGHWWPQALLEAQGHRQPVIEPFAAPGKHAALAKDWRVDVSREADEQRLRACLADAGALVHSVDRGPDSFHVALADAAAQRGSARHLILFLRDSAARLAGLLAARQQRPAIEALIAEDRASAGRLGLVHAALEHARLPVHWLALDDLASDGAAAIPAWRGLWSFLGVQPPEGGAQAEWRQRLRSELADLALTLDPGWQELLRREALWAGSPDMAPACLRTVERPKPDPALKLVRLDRMPGVLRDGDSIRLSGVVVPSGAPVADRRLFLRQGGRRQRVAWDQASPAVAAKWPGEPAAAQARFKPVVIHASRREPVAMLYRPTEKAAAVPVADIAFEPLGQEPIAGIFLAPWSIGYQPIPKVACTSIKELLFRATAGRPFTPELGEGANHIHRYFDLRERDVSAAQFRFLVVRDPIKRFLSAFSNRVLHHKELSRAYVEQLKLVPPLELEDFPFDPDLAGFVDRFESYRRVPTIDHHFRPISEFSAPLAAFDKVYPFEALDELVSDLQARTGVPMSLPHSQRGGPKLQVKDLSPRLFDKLVQLFAADYAMLDGLYSPANLR
jgi:hypothetical protein